MLIGFITGIESYLPFASMVERSKSNSVCLPARQVSVKEICGRMISNPKMACSKQICSQPSGCNEITIFLKCFFHGNFYFFNYFSSRKIRYRLIKFTITIKNHQIINSFKKSFRRHVTKHALNTRLSMNNHMPLHQNKSSVFFLLCHLKITHLAYAKDIRKRWECKQNINYT